MRTRIRKPTAAALTGLERLARAFRRFIERRWIRADLERKSLRIEIRAKKALGRGLAKHARWLAAGVCVKCGSRPTGVGMKTCEPCRAGRADLYRAKRPKTIKHSHGTAHDSDEDYSPDQRARLAPAGIHLGLRRVA